MLLALELLIGRRKKDDWRLYSARLPAKCSSSSLQLHNTVITAAYGTICKVSGVVCPKTRREAAALWGTRRVLQCRTPARVISHQAEANCAAAAALRASVTSTSCATSAAGFSLQRVGWLCRAKCNNGRNRLGNVLVWNTGSQTGQRENPSQCGTKWSKQWFQIHDNYLSRSKRDIAFWSGLKNLVWKFVVFIPNVAVFISTFQSHCLGSFQSWMETRLSIQSPVFSSRKRKEKNQEVFLHNTRSPSISALMSFAETITQTC